MRIYEFLENIIIKNEMRGYHSGQRDMSLIAYLDKNIIGYIDYVDYKGDPSISMIKISDDYKRKGVGKKLIYKLQDMYPDREIDWGMLTDEGNMLYRSLEFIEIPIFDEDRYQRLKKKYNELNKIIQDNWSSVTNKQKNDWYRLENMIDVIENSPQFQKRIKRIIKTY
jgi:GNAT superfamily N-acetyltransferase